MRFQKRYMTKLKVTRCFTLCVTIKSETMIKSEVIKSLVKGLKEKGVNVNKEQATLLQDAVFENLSAILAKGEEVVVENFGKFHSSYTSFNDIAKHKEGPEMNRVQVFVLKFKVSDYLKKKLNGKN